MIDKLRSLMQINEQIHQLEESLKKAQESVQYEIEQLKAAQLDKWEYLVTESLKVHELNRLGELGWELAAASPYGSIKAILGSDTSIQSNFIFKRKVKPIPSGVPDQLAEKYKLEAIEGKIADLKERRAELFGQ